MTHFVKARPALLLIALLVAAPVLVHSPELLGWISCWPMPLHSGLAVGIPVQWHMGQCYIDGNVGGTMEALGHLSAEDWLHFRLPWWNPYSGVGMPLAAGMQPASFFLPFVLLLHFQSGILLLKIAVQVLAGLCMFACMRELRCSLVAACAGALLFEFNGTFAWYGDAPILPIAFLPLLIFGIERCRTRDVAGGSGGIAAVAAGLAGSLLAGFPETAFFDGLLAAAWCAVLIPGMARTEFLRFTARVAAGFGIGLCLAAPALVTFSDYLISGSMVWRPDAHDDVLRDGQAASLLLPMLFGPPYADWALPGWGKAGGYFGVAEVCLGLACVCNVRALTRTRLLALGWSIFWLAAFLGEPITRLIWMAVPGLNQAVLTRYGMPSLEFLWAMLAAMAVDEWRAGRLRFGRPALAVLAIGAGAIIECVAIRRLPGELNLQLLGYVWLTILWSLAIVGLLALITHRTAGRGRLAAILGLLAADAVLPFAVPISAGMVSWQMDLTPVRFLAAQPGYPRIFGIGSRLSPNYGSYFNLSTIRSFSLPAPANWARAAAPMLPELLGLPFAMSGDPESATRVEAFLPLLQSFGVSYVLTDRKQDAIAALHDPRLTAVFNGAAMRIYHLAGAAPYFEARGGTCRLDAISRNELLATCDHRVRLIRRELFSAGWRATVNGAKTGVAEQDGLFQATALPPGPSRVVWWYEPPHGRLILIMAVAGAIGFAASMWASFRHARFSPFRMQSSH
jgi:hypothetical protein